MRASGIRNLRQEEKGVHQSSTSGNWDLLTVDMHGMPCPAQRSKHTTYYGPHFKLRTLRRTPPSSARSLPSSTSPSTAETAAQSKCHRAPLPAARTATHHHQPALDFAQSTPSPIVTSHQAAVLILYGVHKSQGQASQALACLIRLDGPAPAPRLASALQNSSAVPP
ncbi:hypothetical protein CcaCcLH18_02121 [Colletotrichum camelliae]|nr:hypothetical protein CcaCcLH18_02121 [Colletotrichum camelliae]